VRILDSRRLTGPSLLIDGPGAILDVALQGLDPDAAIAAWRSELEKLLEAVGWGDAAIATRTHRDGASLAFTAPIDALYAATEVNEAAWHAAARELGGEAARPDDALAMREDGDEPESAEATIDRLRATIEHERMPALVALAAQAQARGVTVLTDDRRVSVGLGVGSRAWPTEETAAVAPHLPWAELHDIPVALVTGTNGKTTTVRLLGAMAEAAGRTAGVTSTDRVTVGREVVADGDFSGPNGARTVLRDRRVDVAFLEVARGGILRRGLALPRARAALVTNVADDHLGEYGIFDVPALAEVKLVVAKAIGPDGRLVLNADDPLLAERAAALRVPILWFTLDPDDRRVRGHLAGDGEAALLDGDALVLARGDRRRIVARVAEVPIAFGGAARHNLANALAAIGVAHAVGLPIEAIERGLKSFESDPASNPGRANLWRLGGATVIVDFAHNPHGLEALAGMAGSLQARRRAIVVGQAGDREDAAIRAFAARAWAMRPDHVFIKEMESFLRGRERGVVPRLIADELGRLGAEPAARSFHDDELSAVRAALAWARPGDLLILTIHAQRGEVFDLLGRLAATGWTPGEPLDSPVAAERGD
jgi:UDP-N-acetylmuramyl tripeptide synthase